MGKRDLIAAVEGILADERRYAGRLQERGDFGAAKLAWAAISGIESALAAVASDGDATYAERLDGALREQREDYCRLWDDEDGIGTSTFARVLDLTDDSG